MNAAERMLPAARADFAAWLERLAAFDAAPAAALRDLRGKIAAQSFDLVVAGQFKRGKSSVVNALVGAEVMPVGVVPLTSVATVLARGDSASAQVVFDDGRCESIALDAVSAYATERGNPHNAKRVAEVRIAWPAPWLASGVRLVDTPGVGSIHRHNTEAAREFLPKADAVLLVLSVEQPLGAEERAWLDEIGALVGKTFFLLNKADLLDAAELRDSVEFTAAALREAVGSEVAVFPVSARLALAARGDAQAFAASGFPALLRALDDFLRRERDAVLHASTLRRLRRLAAQTRASLELERGSLATPLDALQDRIARFAARKSEVRGAREDSALLLGREAAGLWMQRIDAELAALRDGLRPRVAAAIDAAIAANADASTPRLSALAESAAVECIRSGFDAWREAKNRALAAEFSAWCARHARQVDDAVDELFRCAADLFDVDYAAIRADSAWNVQSGFHYKFWSEPPSLRLLADALARHLPGALGRRVLRKRLLASSLESIDTQSGRVRYDFLQRLDASLRSFRNELAARIDTAIGGIDAAIDKGARLHAAGAAACTKRLAALDEEIAALARIEAQMAATDGERQWS